eukprot:2378146-Pleurochrysis_carterae.AAC.1
MEYGVICGGAVLRAELRVGRAVETVPARRSRGDHGEITGRSARACESERRAFRFGLKRGLWRWRWQGSGSRSVIKYVKLGQGFGIGLGLGLGSGLKLGPVSYTHLTLPTILLV